MRFYILDSQTNRMLFLEGQRAHPNVHRKGPGFSVPVSIREVTAIDGKMRLQDVSPATASIASNIQGKNFSSYKAGIKCAYMIRVWPKVKTDDA